VWGINITDTILMYVLTSLSRTMSLPYGICECLPMRSHSQKVGTFMLLEWFIKAQNDVTVKTVIRSFKKYDILNSMDGTQGNLVMARWGGSCGQSPTK
jgi:hypothetical protein